MAGRRYIFERKKAEEEGRPITDDWRKGKKKFHHGKPLEQPSDDDNDDNNDDSEGENGSNSEGQDSGDQKAPAGSSRRVDNSEIATMPRHSFAKLQELAVKSFRAPFRGDFRAHETEEQPQTSTEDYYRYTK